MLANRVGSSALRGGGDLHFKGVGVRWLGGQEKTKTREQKTGKGTLDFNTFHYFIFLMQFHHLFGKFGHC